MKDFFRDHVLHNLGLKLVSLVLAAGLWLVLARDKTAVVAVVVPVELQNIPDNLEVSSEHIHDAEVRVRGPERTIHRLQSSDVHAELDLSHIRPGEHTFDLNAEQIRVPRGLQVEQVIPSQLHLAFDTRMTREVEVHPRVTGAFAAGYTISRIEVVPSVVTIIGPKTRVQAVDNAMTDPIDVSGNMDRHTFVTHAYVADPLIQVVNPEIVQVTVIMQKAPNGAAAPETSNEVHHAQ
jgi:YbbR domain-containing protein